MSVSSDRPRAANDYEAIRARLAQLSREALQAIVEQATAPKKEDPPNPDGSRMIRVPGGNGRTLMFRLSADDLRL